MIGRLYAERDGHRTLRQEDVTPDEAAAFAEDDDKWPEGSMAVYVDSSGHEWVYTDQWDSLEDDNATPMRRTNDNQGLRPTSVRQL